MAVVLGTHRSFLTKAGERAARNPAFGGGSGLYARMLVKIRQVEIPHSRISTGGIFKKCPPGRYLTVVPTQAVAAKAGVPTQASSSNRLRQYAAREGTAAVKMFHILETRPTKVRWCRLARERGTSTASPLVSTVLVLRVATLGGCRNPVRCGTPCTCGLWNTTSPATSLRCSSESRGLVDSGWAGGSEASTNRRARRWMLSSFLVCEAAHVIQERAAYSK
ncbi:hypothetical protein GWK47_002215 [Chionoecetes opilio]|uniref:Uncharacterized protein n=1 Tax=Chionoecetes opilio TaxID=41210 RepID=A0A8J4XQC3_CHIOP|nr:hypothetical protein GWK47_002215 [Chionoecetes opilio]